MRVLVTGAAGFVGRRLVRRLERRAGVELFALARRARDAGAPRARDAGEPPVREEHEEREASGARTTWLAVDLDDRRAALAAVRAVAPDRVVHLAALADPRRCAEDPVAALRTNAGGTAAVLGALVGSGARALVVGSSAVYGPGRGDGAPIRESSAQEPRNAYGRSKRCQEAVARAFARRGVELVIARPFNHSGAGQSASYVLPALAAEVVRAREGGGELRTGNLFPRRDFLHVDDVLDAYLLLLERGAPGEVYNVCRGEARSIGELLDGLLARLGADLRPLPDPDRVRAEDPPLLVGDASKLGALGWGPRVSWDALLDDVAQAAGCAAG